MSPYYYPRCFSYQIGVRGSQRQRGLEGLACFSPDSLRRSPGTKPAQLVPSLWLAELAATHPSASPWPHFSPAAHSCSTNSSTLYWYHGKKGSYHGEPNNSHLCLRREGMAFSFSDRLDFLSALTVTSWRLSQLLQDVTLALLETVHWMNDILLQKLSGSTNTGVSFLGKKQIPYTIGHKIKTWLIRHQGCSFPS